MKKPGRYEAERTIERRGNLITIRKIWFENGVQQTVSACSADGTQPWRLFNELMERHLKELNES